MENIQISRELLAQYGQEFFTKALEDFSIYFKIENFDEIEFIKLKNTNEGIFTLISYGDSFQQESDFKIKKKVRLCEKNHVYGINSCKYKNY